MKTAIIIMFVTALGNSLIFVVLKSPVVIFCWYHLLMCLILPLLDNFIVHKRRLQNYFELTGIVKPVKIHYLVISCLTGCLILAAILIYYINNRSVLTKLIQFDFPLWLVITGTVYTLLLNSLLEEIFWRGYIHSLCLVMRSRFLAILLNAAFFTSFHIFILFSFLGTILMPLVLSFLVFLAGLLFEFFREKSKSIFPSLLLHFLIAVGYILVFLDLYFS